MEPTFVEKYAKGLTSFAFLAFAVIALFFSGDIFGFQIEADFEAKVIALIPLAAGVVAVIGAKNATVDSVDKAIMQFVTGAISVAEFFTQVPSDLGVKIGAVVSTALAFYFVWRVPNNPGPQPVRIPQNR